MTEKPFNIIGWAMAYYRESPDSAVFGSPANRTIGKTALIGDWFSTKPTILDFWIFKVHFFGKLFAYLITFQFLKFLKKKLDFFEKKAPQKLKNRTISGNELF
jgi:hypothetical protein